MISLLSLKKLVQKLKLNNLFYNSIDKEAGLVPAFFIFRQGGKEARRQGGKEARRQGGKEARRQGTIY